jgi:arsenate reductase
MTDESARTEQSERTEASAEPTQTPRLYVNPACSKCRSAIAILTEHHVEAEQVRYLDTPPTVAELERLMELLGIDDPRQMMRTGEPEYAELRLDGAPAAELLQGIVTHPILLQRPIFVVGDRAVVARPPERLHDLLGLSSPGPPGP